jgi:2-hydroxy fatty acid dioxygenase
MEPVAGIMVAPVILSVTSYCQLLLELYGNTANKWAGAVFIVSWLAQFVGHGKFEGRAPALLDNLVQALLLAPFFVWFEILFQAGYRPELHARLQKAVEVEVQKFQSEKKENGAAARKQE